MLRFFAGIVWRDLLIIFRHPVAWLIPLAFFLLVVVIFSIAAAESPSALRSVSPGVIWATVLLAVLLPQDGIFRHDYDSGFIQQILTTARPLAVCVLAKAVAYWLATGGLLASVVPLAAIALGFPSNGLVMLLTTVLFGSVILSLLATFAAALTVGQKNALLATLLVLPLCVPVLIFANAAVSLTLAGFSAIAPLSYLAALGVLAVTFLPLAGAGVLRAVGGGR